MAKAEVTVRLADYDEVKQALARLMAMVDAFMPPCTQCGQPFRESACGPTHAVIAAYPLQHRQARWWTDHSDGEDGAR
jgi:hypothetical protein